ncbi:hypothetical protein LPJ64_003751 [Coemansia asiatica]|uniref:Glycosyltransferase family 25 protein n=1 Tax=Coemansia asiatica TaxID=1052880 RepID=A0A9W7XK89_9FUNG|nr:hypothetical protein LPJ64_003751 [Coemansia asiatica]
MSELAMPPSAGMPEHMNESLLPSSSYHKASCLGTTKDNHRRQTIYERFKPQLLILVFVCLSLSLYLLTKDTISQALAAAKHVEETKQSDSNRNDNGGTSHLPLIPMRPYKDTAIHMPVLPTYGSAEQAQLGFDHIYVVHRLGYPENLVRMAKILQMLHITAEFVPVLPIPKTKIPSSMVQPLEHMQEWHTRHRIYRDMLEAGYKSALILDDSVDMELNIKTIMRAVHQSLPHNWDMFFPGHCGAFESSQPRPSDKLPSLRHANMPICLHAHAVSQKGAKRIVANLSPSPTTDEIISMAIMRLKERGLLQMYSLDTPVFAPRPAGSQAHKSSLLAGNKKLQISAINHFDTWKSGRQPRKMDA